MDDVSQNQDEENDGSDPGIEAGWRALDSGDVAAARAAAEVAIATPAPAGADGDGDVEPNGVRLEGLLLQAACAREEGDTKTALASLTAATKEDPTWCTPALWLAEVMAAEAEETDQLSEALKQARRALDLAEEEDEFLSSLACTATLELAMGRKAAARKTLSELPAADVPFDDPQASVDFCELLIEADDLAEARKRAETLTTARPELPEGWYLLGVTAELMDDEDGKRAAWMKVRSLDMAALDAEAADGTDHDHHDHDGHDHVGHDHEHHHHHGPRLTEEALVAVAEETLAEFPDDLRAPLKNVPIVVADLPAVADVASGLDPRLLGMFSGTPHAENGGVLEPASLTEIVLFRRNIERVASDEETLREEVRITLLHEAGHFFGLDEERLASLGLD